jgi:hypothetical protein
MTVELKKRHKVHSMCCLQLVSESLLGDKPNLNNVYICIVKIRQREEPRRSEILRQFFMVSN